MGSSTLLRSRFLKPRSWNSFRESSRWQQTRNLSLAYTSYKPKDVEDNPARSSIIIMHGLFGSKQNNRSISKALARDLKTDIYAIDLRNHGDSPHDLRHDYIAMAEDVEEFIDQHSLQRPILIGHSMGAKVALTIALRNRTPIDSLVSVDNAPVDAALNSDFAKYIQGMRKIEDARVKKQAQADEILQEFESSAPIRAFLLTNLIRHPRTTKLVFRVPIATLGKALGNMGDFPFKDPEEARFDGPALFVRGTESHYVADEMLPLVGRFFPRFELKDIQCGHWVISEKPTELRAGEFLEFPVALSRNIDDTLAIVEFLTSKEEHE